MIKKVRFIDILDLFRALNLKRTTQLFIISIIALNNERRRKARKGLGFFYFDDCPISYDITVCDKEIRKKFNFSVDTMVRIRKELKRADIKVKLLEILTKKSKYPFKPIYYKNFNILYRYSFAITRKNRRILFVPTKIIYDKSLKYSEKMALIWNISLREKLKRQPKLVEIERESGISERTIRKAKNKYPMLFLQ